MVFFHGLLSLAVSPGLIDRSLRILDALLKALEQRGMPVSVTEGDDPRTEVKVLDEQIGFCLYEDTIREEREPTQQERDWELRWNPERKFYRYVPSGKLVLRITDGSGLRRCWTDRSDRRVEQFLNSFVVGLVRVAESLKEEHAKAERRRKEREEQERRRQEEEKSRREEERLQREEEARFSKLQAEVAAWTQAQQIRAYIVAAKETANARGGGYEIDSDLDKRLRWAERRAEDLDPLMKSRNEAETAEPSGWRPPPPKG